MGASAVPTKLKFLHLPKTAGVSVRIYLSGFFPRAEICPAETTGRHAPPLARLQPYRVFMGHYDWEALDAIDGPCFSFTILREPLARVLSYYFHLRGEALRLGPRTLASGGYYRQMDAALRMPPDVFFGTGGPAPLRGTLDCLFDNFYTYFFAGRRFDARKQLRNRDEDEVVAQALANLATLDRVYSIDDLAPLQRDIVSRFGTQRGIPPPRELVSRAIGLDRIGFNSGEGDVNAHLERLRALGATGLTFDRLSEITRLDARIWAAYRAPASSPGPRLRTRHKLTRLGRLLK